MSDATTSDVLATLEHLRMRAETAERDRDAAMRIADDWREKCGQLRELTERALAQRDDLLAACEHGLAQLAISGRETDDVTAEVMRVMRAAIAAARGSK